MERYDLPVADRYHDLDIEVRTLLDNLHDNAATYFEDFERNGILPVRGMLRTDIGDLNNTRGVRNLLQAEAIDISQLFKLDMRYRRQAGDVASNITLGLNTRVDPETNKEYYDIYATKSYPKLMPHEKLGAHATRLAGHAVDLYETKARPKLQGLQKKLGSFASRVSQRFTQR